MSHPPAIVTATRGYEVWLARQVRPWRDDLAFKHEVMAGNPLAFLRGTFYRWADLWRELCADLAEAPELLAVGDVHVDNYGTWRDVEGRLVWGLNDFDEATSMPYTQDLVRLAASTRMTIQVGGLGIGFRDACQAILDGYTAALHAGGKPIVLAENGRWLRRIATSDLRDPVVFWERMEAIPALIAPPQGAVRSVLLARLPDDVTEVRWVRRRAGVGSLGRPRLVAIARWHGALVAREAKTLLPSSWHWADDASAAPRFAELAAAAVRCPDPGLQVEGGWITRRLAPDCSKVQLVTLPAKRDEHRLVRSMGWELGNVHAGTPSAVPAVIEDLAVRSNGWLRRSARLMAEATFADWKAWRAAPK